MPEVLMKKNIYRYRRKRKINIKRLLLLIVFLCIIAVMPTMTSSLFAVKNIQVMGNKNISAGEIIKAADFFYDKNLLTIKEKDVKKAISESIPVKEVHLTYKLPNTLVISVKEREVAAALPYLSGFILIDADGVVVKMLSKLDSIIVPVVTGFEITHASVAGRPAIRNNEDSFRKLLELISAISPLSSELSEIHVDKGNANDTVFYLYTLDGYQIFLGSFEARKIQVMKQILDDLRKNGRGKGEINISGETPVFKPFSVDGGEDKP
jgi:cell division protein FtsQ